MSNKEIIKEQLNIIASTENVNKNDYLRLAIAYDNEKQYGSAYSFYLRFLESDPIYYDLSKIETDLEKHIDCAYSYFTYIRMGLICEIMGDRVYNAIVWYERAINFAPAYCYAYYFLSRLYERQGHSVEHRWKKAFKYANIGCHLLQNYHYRNYHNEHDLIYATDWHFNRLNYQHGWHFNSDIKKIIDEFNIDYPGHHGIFFQRSVAASWTQDYKNLAPVDLKFILKEFPEMDELHFNCTIRNLKFLNKPIPLTPKTIPHILEGIEGFCSPDKADELIHLIKNNNLKTVVELGVYGGSSLIPMALALQDILNSKVYAIDAWDNKVSLEGQKSKEHKDFWGNKNHKQIFEHFKSNLHHYELNDIVEIIKDTTDNAVKQFEGKGKFIDLLHIDGNHSARQSLNDVINYSKYVKDGGYIVLDDVHWKDGEENTTKHALEYLKNNYLEIKELKNSSYDMDIAVFKVKKLKYGNKERLAKNKEFERLANSLSDRDN